MINTLPSLERNEAYVLYDADSLFTNILLTETIDYIIKSLLKSF